MPYDNFVQVRRDEDGAPWVRIVHTVPPKFFLDIQPETDAEGEIVAGTLKRIRLPNAWAGDYHKYNPLIRQAISFFRRCHGLPGEDRVRR